MKGYTTIKNHEDYEHEKPVATFQSYRVFPQKHPSLIRKIIDRVNWGRAFDLIGWGLAILALGYVFGFVILGAMGLWSR